MLEEAIEWLNRVPFEDDDAEIQQAFEAEGRGEVKL